MIKIETNNGILEFRKEENMIEKIKMEKWRQQNSGRKNIDSEKGG